MDNNTKTNNIIETLRALMETERYDDAVGIIGELEKKTELSPRLLVVKGDAIQLSSDAQPLGLDVAEESYRRAISLDDRYADAILELAWFLYTINDKPDEAKSLFEKALAICRRQAAEAILGIGKCLFEIEGKHAALVFLTDYKSRLYDEEDIQKIDALRQEIEDSADDRCTR